MSFPFISYSLGLSSQCLVLPYDFISQISALSVLIFHMTFLLVICVITRSVFFCCNFCSSFCVCSLRRTPHFLCNLLTVSLIGCLFLLQATYFQEITEPMGLHIHFSFVQFSGVVVQVSSLIIFCRIPPFISLVMDCGHMEMLDVSILPMYSSHCFLPFFHRQGLYIISHVYVSRAFVVFFEQCFKLLCFPSIFPFFV